LLEKDKPTASQQPTAEFRAVSPVPTPPPASTDRDAELELEQGAIDQLVNSLLKQNETQPPVDTPAPATQNPVQPVMPAPTPAPNPPASSHAPNTPADPAGNSFGAFWDYGQPKTTTGTYEKVKESNPNHLVHIQLKEGRSLPVDIEDLNIGGITVRAPEQFTERTSVLINLSIDGFTVLNIVGSCDWCGKYHDGDFLAGFIFGQLSPDQAAKIRELVKRYTSSN
jgi:hypothetical protein